MYEVIMSKKFKDQGFILKNGEVIAIVSIRSLNDYYEEVVNEGNECAVKIMMFTTEKGGRFIFWRDIETQENFITKLATKEGKQ